MYNPETRFRFAVIQSSIKFVMLSCPFNCSHQRDHIGENNGQRRMSMTVVILHLWIKRSRILGNGWRQNEHSNKLQDKLYQQTTTTTTTGRPENQHNVLASFNSPDGRGIIHSHTSREKHFTADHSPSLKPSFFMETDGKLIVSSLDTNEAIFLYKIKE